MKLTREHGLTAFVLVVFVALVVWVARNTEWVNEEVPDPPSAELKRDPHLRLKQLLTRVGAKVETPTNLDRLPPPGTTLVLGSSHWNLFTEREPALRRWVEAGGHLVNADFGSLSGGLGWLPVRRQEWRRRDFEVAAGSAPASSPSTDTDRDDEDDDDEDRADKKNKAAPLPPPPGQTRPPVAPAVIRGCPGVNEPEGVTPAYDIPRGFSTCMPLYAALQTSAPLLWAIDGPRGHVAVRIAAGRGRATLVTTELPWDNDDLLTRDNALITVATLDAHAGSEIWLVTEESRPPLLSFLWQRGAPAVLLFAAALALALWRGARRFGPRLAALPLARRSMAEQIRGTAHFIAHRGSPALHTAQLRALNEAAAPRIRGYAAMTLGQRAGAIAALTRLDAHTLAHAMNPALSATPSRHPAAALALIETARRRLLLNVGRTPAASNESR
jgi:hypothetical protein